MKAVIWDVDGTLAETERDGHRVAFNQAFAQHGLPWHWSEERYGELLEVSGGRERLLFDMRTHADAPQDLAAREALAKQLHVAKNACYAAIVQAGRIPLRPGVEALMEECRSQSIAMAIATTTSRANVDALLRAHLGSAWRERFQVVLCGEDTANKKPHPEVYERALRSLAVAPQDAVAIEDSPNGALAARAAMVPVIVTRGAYFRTAIFAKVLAIGDGLDALDSWQPTALAHANKPYIGIDDLRAWLVGAARDRSRTRVDEST